MSDQQKLPEHQAVYERLKDLLLIGYFAPGEPLTIQGLIRLLDAGMTPVREAIRRLTAENALQSLGNRRVAVPKFDRKRFEDIYFLRLRIEPELAARATKHMPDPAIKQLVPVDKAVSQAIQDGNVEQYLDQNRVFHFAIYEHAESEVLLRTTQSLWVQAGPCLRVVCGRFGTANLPDKHTELIEALRARDADTVARALREDLEQGLDLACQSFETPNLIKP